MKRWRVTTVVHEFHFVDAETEDDACEAACAADEPNSIDVRDRYAEEWDD